MEQMFLWLKESRTTLGLLGVLVIFWFGYNTVGITLRNYDLAQQISTLEDEISLLQLENQNFKFLIGYYNTDSFLELEARDKLSKVGANEKVLVLPEDRYDKLTSNEVIPDEANSIGDNLNEWTEFLFGLGG